MDVEQRPMLLVLFFGPCSERSRSAFWGFLPLALSRGSSVDLFICCAGLVWFLDINGVVGCRIVCILAYTVEALEISLVGGCFFLLVLHRAFSCGT